MQALFRSTKDLIKPSRRGEGGHTRQDKVLRGACWLQATHHRDFRGTERGGATLGVRKSQSVTVYLDLPVWSAGCLWNFGTRGSDVKS